MTVYLYLKEKQEEELVNLKTIGMEKIEQYSANLLESLEKNDFSRYQRCRNIVVAEVEDEMLMLRNIQDYLLVGKALTIILDDFAVKNNIIYKRVLLSAVYCLLSVLLNDKNDNQQNNAMASALLLILFTENENFIGADYLIDKFVNAQKAAEQYMAMQCVFYWIYKLSKYPVSIKPRTSIRVLDAFTHTITQIPDENQRKRVVDFEYKNFESMVKSIDMDLTLKYLGVDTMMIDYDVMMNRISKMFKTTSSYFIGSNESNVDPRIIPNSSTETSKSYSSNSSGSNGNYSNSGCMFLIIALVSIAVTISLI